MIGEALNRWLGTKDDELKLPKDMLGLVKHPHQFQHLVLKPILGISDDHPEGDIPGWEVWDQWTDGRGKQHSELAGKSALFKNKSDPEYKEFDKYINRANRILPIARSIKDVLVVSSLGASAVLMGVLLVNKLESDHNPNERLEQKPSISSELSSSYSPLHSAGALTNQSFIFDDDGVVIKLH